MPKSNLLKDFVNEQLDIETVLFRLKIILNDLGNKDIIKWIEKELKGYSEGDILPEYRILKGKPFGTIIVNGALKIPDTLITLNSANKFLTDENIDKILTITVKDGVGSIEKNLKSENRDKLVKPMPTEFCQLLSSPQRQILNMNIKFTGNSFDTILVHVKDKVLDIIIELEKNFGHEAIDNMDISKTLVEEPEKRERTITYIQQLVLNENPTSVEIGDGNKFNNSEIGRFFNKK